MAFPPQNWSKIILVGSLALNLAVIGVVAGAWIGGDAKRAHDRNGSSNSKWSAGPYGRALSKEDRREMGDRMRATGAPKIKETRRAMRDAGREVVLALRAEPFVAEAVEAALEKQRALGAQQIAVGQTLLLEQITSMTPDTRAAFADRLEEALSRRKRDRD